ncbi:Ubiquitin binding protein, PLAA family protein [Giardia muris]|uniref:Ubiquitin binding protein, PLAA family protein n=1 Tax=Giardia muris TaxID=5742 RepID=A0A4Z1SZF4_GIAMU|nr:Ubiquitin binding protein, PLAA family protein [Giardia muris]|eukprot:TNJ28858.1 Ubiquitin binding protein, PLAA family protein [Giardia muris]
MKLRLGSEWDAHREVVRTLAKSETHLFSGGLDGSLIARRLVDGGEPQELTKLAGISALCRASDSLIVCTTDGLVFRLFDSGDLVGIREKQDARISAACYLEERDILVYSDWDSQLCIYINASQPSRLLTVLDIPPFTNEEGGLTPNTCLTLTFAGTILIAGFSDGYIRLFDITTSIPCYFTDYLLELHVHRRPVRGLSVVTSEYLRVAAQTRKETPYIPKRFFPIFYSVGNDGRVNLNYPTSPMSYVSHCISSPQLLEQYLFTATLFQHLGRAYLAAGGCDILLYVFDVTEDLATLTTGKPPQQASASLAGAFPTVSDIWDIVPAKTAAGTDCLYLALENGQVQQVLLDPVIDDALSKIQTRYLAGFGRLSKIPPSRVTGSHRSLVTTASVACKTMSQLRECRNPFEGRIVVAIEEDHNTPALYVRLDSQWLLYGTFKEDCLGEKVADVDGKVWDMSLPVVNDQTGRSYTIYMNLGEDPMVVVQRFIRTTDVLGTNPNDLHQYEKMLLDFVIQNAPCTEVQQVFQVSWDDPHNYLLSNLQTSTPIIDLSILHTSTPRVVDHELLQKCSSLLTTELYGEDIRMSCLLNNLSNIGPSTLNLDDFVTLLAQFDELVTSTLKNLSADAATQRLKMVSCYLVVFSHILQDSEAAPRLYQALAPTIKNGAIPRLFIAIANGSVTEKTCCIFLIRFLAWFAHAHKDGLGWLEWLNTACTKQNYKKFVDATKEDLGFLMFSSSEKYPDVQAFARGVEEAQE